MKETVSIKEVENLIKHYGGKILRKNSKDQWVESILNKTYFPLVLQYPEDYKLPVINKFSGPTLWVYDDLWEEGYRFDCKITRQYCFIPRNCAENETVAVEFLVAYYDYIPKLQGTSQKVVFEILNNDLTALIVR